MKRNVGMVLSIFPYPAELFLLTADSGLDAEGSTYYETATSPMLLIFFQLVHRSDKQTTAFSLLDWMIATCQ